MRSDWACGKLIVSWFGSPKTTRFLGENLGPPHGFSTFFADDPFLGVIYDLNLTPSPMQYQMLSRWFWNVWTYIINIILYYIIYRRWIQTTISDRKRRTKLPKPQIDSSLVCVFFATWPFFWQIYIISPQDHDSGVGCLYRQVGGIRVSMRHFLSQTSWYPFRGVATHILYIIPLKLEEALPQPVCSIGERSVASDLCPQFMSILILNFAKIRCLKLITHTYIYYI